MITTYVEAFMFVMARLLVAWLVLTLSLAVWLACLFTRISGGSND